MQASTAPDIRTGCSTIRWLMQSTQLRILKKLKTQISWTTEGSHYWIHSQLHSYILYIKEFDRKSFCQIWFCVAESFLITHLDPPESWKVGGDISYTSSDNCHVIEKLFSPPAPFKEATSLIWVVPFVFACVRVCLCLWSGLCLRRIALVKKLIPKFCVISSSRWRGRFAKYWIYLGSVSLNNFFTNSDLHHFKYQSHPPRIMQTITTTLKLFGIGRNWTTISKIIMFSMERWDNLRT